MVNQILCGHVLEERSNLPSDCIDMIVTSPPYWGLRSYGISKKFKTEHEIDHYLERKKEAYKELFRGKNVYPVYSKNYNQKENQWVGEITFQNIWDVDGEPKWKGSLGLEPTPELYIRHLVQIFEACRNLLKPTGTLWVNLGDSYSGSGMGTMKGDPPPMGKQVYALPHAKNISRTSRNGEIPAKSLVGIPFRFALAMITKKWILRNTIIWQKPNVLPSSVKDRFTVDFEYLFFFSQNRKYYFNQQFEPYSDVSEVQYRKLLRSTKNYDTKDPYSQNFPYQGQATKDYKQHKAQNPSDTKRRIMKAILEGQGRNKRTTWSINTKAFPEAHFAVFPEELIETPIKAGCPPLGIVFDPFFGSGTTGVVALKQGKDFIGIELNPDYIQMAKTRLRPYLAQQRLDDYLETRLLEV